MDDLSVREATLKDKAEVLCIHDNVFEGSDYLPVYYDHFLASPDITPFVLLQQNKIVGYAAAHIVDDGRTVVTRAVRLKPQVEGKGFYGYMDKYILDWAKSKHATTKAFTSSDANTSTAKSSFQKVNSLILSKKTLAYSMVMEKLYLITETLDDSITIVSDNLLETYISSSNIKNYLFPQDRIIVDYLPCKLLTSNIPFMKGPGDSTSRVSDVSVSKDHCTGLLTCGTIYPCKENTILHCTLEFYGTDPSSINKHVVKHMSVAKHKAAAAGLGKAVARFALSVDKEIADEVVDNVFIEHGAERLCWKDPQMSKEIYIENFLFEKDL